MREIDVELAGRRLRVRTAPGVFSAGEVDLGTRVLLRDLAPPAHGELLDLGCGWGPIALSLAIRAPEARVWAVDVNRRALELMSHNAGERNIRAVLPEEVPPDIRFGGIWSNPPIRIGKSALHALLATWLPRLLPDAAAHLVVQRNLGADSLHRWLAERYVVERIASAKGFRVLRVTR